MVDQSITPYTEGYFERAEGSHYHGYEDWPQFRQRAGWIRRVYHPASVYELGAAKGYLLKHLIKKNVVATGCDVSEYAASQSEGRVVIHDITKEPLYLAGFDLVVSFDVLEHIPEEDFPMLFESLRTARQQFHMITTSEYDFGGDITHFTSKPLQWWQDQFEKNGVKNYRIIHAGQQEVFRANRHQKRRVVC